jgi:hypothetical protein
LGASGSGIPSFWCFQQICGLGASNSGIPPHTAGWRWSTICSLKVDGLHLAQTKSVWNARRELNSQGEPR